MPLIAVEFEQKTDNTILFVVVIVPIIWKLGQTNSVNVLVQLEFFFQEKKSDIIVDNIFCFVFGMSGSMVSLFLSKWMAKMSTRTQIIEQPRTSEERWLLETYGSCPDLDFANAVGLDVRGSISVCTGQTETLLVPSTIPGEVDRCPVRVLGRVIEDD